MRSGPPLWLVAPVFVALVSLWLAPAAPAFGLALAVMTLVASLIASVRAWPWLAHADREVAASSAVSLGRRMRAAYRARLERARWR